MRLQFINVFFAVLGIVLSPGIQRTATADVFVDLSDDGVLTIIGDDESNSVSIEVDDLLTVSTSSSGNHSFDVFSINHLVIDLGRDVDIVSLTFLHPLFADISISTGQERDVVTLQDRQAGSVEFSNFVAGNLTINSGHGDDRVRLSSMAIWGDVDISTGNGRDLIDFNTFNDTVAMAGSNDILGSLSINTGVDQDRISFNIIYGFGTNIGEDLLLELGQGDDSIVGDSQNQVYGGAYLSGGQGFDTCPDDVVTALELIKIGFES